MQCRNAGRWTQLRLESRVYAVHIIDKALTACRRRALARRGKAGLRTKAEKVAGI